MDERFSKVFSSWNKFAKPQADRYKALFDNSADAILIIEDGRFIDCNQSAVDLLRYMDKRSILNCHPSDLSPEFQPDGMESYVKANKMMQQAVENGSHRFEWEHMREDGEVFPVEVVLTAMYSDSSSPTSSPQIHTVWRDISERKMLEHQLRHSQKMEAVGKLAGGIAHDFNNQLVPILGYCELLAAKLEDNPDLQGYVGEINRAGTRASNLVKKLLVFSRQDSRQEVTVDLNRVVENLLGMLRQLIGEDIELEFIDWETPLGIKIDPGDIEQIVLNMATNARDAMPGGGKLSIEISLKKKPAGIFTSLCFRDTGTGMDNETIEQVFVPFFTTKGLGAGTGLGMSGAFELASKAGGTIIVESEPGKGSCFDVLIPLSREDIVDPEQDIKQGKIKKIVGSNRDDAHILVVEDDSQIATLINKVLTELGYQVTLATGGEQALDFLGKSIIKPDLVVSDVIMPGMSGPKMVSEMKVRKLHIPVLFMSGYTNERLATHGFDTAQVSILRKPFTPTLLHEKIREMLSVSEDDLNF